MKQDIWIKAGNGVLLLICAFVCFYILKALYYVTIFSFIFTTWFIAGDTHFGDHVAQRNNERQNQELVNMIKNEQTSEQQ